MHHGRALIDKSTHLSDFLFPLGVRFVLYYVPLPHLSFLTELDFRLTAEFSVAEYQNQVQTDRTADENGTSLHRNLQIYVRGLVIIRTTKTQQKVPTLGKVRKTWNKRKSHEEKKNGQKYEIRDVGMSCSL